MRASSEFSPEQAREVGKSYFFNNAGDSEKKNYGLKLILQAESFILDTVMQLHKSTTT